MNLAEYPIALLADRAPNGIKTIVYHDKDETLTITGSDLLGLPTALDVDVIIGLLHLTKTKSNFESTTIDFTRYELIRILGWPDRGFYYERLTESLNRWVGVTLVYKKSWWDNETKTKGNHSFHILDAATVIEQEQRRGCRAKQIAAPPLLGPMEHGVLQELPGEQPQEARPPVLLLAPDARFRSSSTASSTNASTRSRSGASTFVPSRASTSG